MPQWDFLELLATAAEKEPTFTLMRSTEVLGPLLRDGRVVGVRYRDADGETREMHADVDGGVRRPLVDAAYVDGLDTQELRGADGRVVVPAAAPTPTIRTAWPACSAPGTRAS